MTSEKSPLRYLLAGAGIQFATLAASAIIGFLLTPLMIHTLGDRDYGLLELVGSFTGWLGLVDFGLSGAVARYVAINFASGDQHESNAFAVTGFFLYLGLGLVAFVLAGLAALVLPWLLTYEADLFRVRTLLMLAAASFAIDMPLRALSGLLNGYMRRDITGWLYLLSRILQAVATVAVLSLGGRLIFLSITSLFLTVAIAMLWWLAVKWIIPGFQLDSGLVDRKRARSLVNFGGVSFIGHLAEMIIYRVDAFVIAWFIAIAAVPHYIIAVTLVSYFGSTMAAITGWLMNWFAHKGTSGKDAVNESLYLSTRYCVILGGFCIFGLIAFGKPFIERWMGTSYLDAYPCLVALSVAAYIRACQQPMINLLLTHAKHYVYAMTRVCEAILNLLLSITLVQRYGILGVALGTMLASIIVNGLFFPFASCCAVQASVVRFAVAILHGLCVALVLVAVPTLIVTATVTPSYSSLFILGILSACLYFPMAFALGSTSSERKKLAAAYFG